MSSTQDKSGKSPGKTGAGKAKRASTSGKSKGSSGVVRHTYVEMLQTALMTLNERGGSSRQAIWKFIEAKFPEANRKIFLVRLKKYSGENGFIVKGKTSARFSLNRGFRLGLEKRVAKGMTVARAADHLARNVPLKQAVKKKAKKPTKPKTKKKAKRVSKKSDKPKSTKAKVKAKASSNKKTTGGVKAKA